MTITAIRMLDSETGRVREGERAKHWRAGSTYRVPQDVPDEIAESWLKIGLAEEVKESKQPPKGDPSDKKGE